MEDDDGDRFGVTYFDTDRKRHTKKRMRSFSRNYRKILILGDVMLENKMFWGKKRGRQYTGSTNKSPSNHFNVCLSAAPGFDNIRDFSKYYCCFSHWGFLQLF